MKCIPTTDHNGNKYESVASMCRAYGIAPETYWARIKKGWTKKDALLIKPHGNNRTENYRKIAQETERRKALNAYNLPINKIIW